MLTVKRVYVVINMKMIKLLVVSYHIYFNSKNWLHIIHRNICENGNDVFLDRQMESS